MARFCFNADRKDAHEFLKTFYERVDVDFELNEQESCIILKDRRDKDIFLSLNERLIETKGFSQPTYVPKWKNIKHKGPYFPRYDNAKFYNSVLYDKTRTKQLKLTAEEEKYAFLYAPILIANSSELEDEVFKNNFWTDFKKHLSVHQPFNSLDEIDWVDVIQKYKKKNTNISTNNKKFEYGIIQIDNQTYSAIPFSVDDISIFYGNNANDPKRGMIKRAITPADVTLNLSPQYIKDIPNANSFKEIVYKPGMRWAAKWQHPITKKYKYMEIYFTHPDDEDFIENYESGDEILSNSDSEGDDDVDSDSDNEVDDYPEEDVDNEENANFKKIERQQQRRMEEAIIEKEWRKRAVESISNEDLINFQIFDEQEQDLPLSYLSSEKQQWEYILDACRSNFRVVKNLGKVSNRILEIVADAAQLALEQKVNKNLNKYILEYANKRDV